MTAGQTAAFSVVATGTAPLSYQWQENDANIAGATSASYTTSATTTSESGSTFTVVVSNSAGSATSASATLTITSGAVAPTISTQPASQTVTAGQTATFSVVAAGTAPLSYHWQKNGANITGATATSYTTPATASSDSGSTFDVVVSNTAGTITSAAAALIVNAAAVAPTITTQPTNQTVTAGQTATFSVVAAGSAPLSYQWQKNGANITGATATSYTTPATASSDSGSTFDVVVSNTAGTITSAAATLTVNAAVQHSVALTWDASTSTVVGYNVYRGTASGGPYTQINPSLVAALDYTDSTVQDSTTYYYVTTAVDSGGNESIYSNEAPAVVP
ncbi:MAG: immunoglobulin domain-containing protein [Candidatus Acidiferrales bacterium]